MNQESLCWDVTNENLCIWDWNLETGAIGVSSNWLRILGMQPSEYNPTSQWFNKLIHPEDLPLVLFNLESNLSMARDQDQFHFRLKRKDGRYMNFRSQGIIVLQQPDGQPGHVIWASEYVCYLDQ